MKKLLYERLMEREKKGCTGDILAKVIGCEEPQCTGLDCRDCVAALMDKLADEIERYYIAFPCDKTGKPWYIGDEAISGEGVEFIVQGVGYDNEGYPYLVEVDSGNIYDCKWCTRSKPKVYDADGVEINGGDTVWSVDTSKKYEVVNIYEETVDVKETGSYGCIGGIFPNRLTHKEPDSLEKLLEYLDSKYNLSRFELDGVRDRLSALIERGA